MKHLHQNTLTTQTIEHQHRQSTESHAHAGYSWYQPEFEYERWRHGGWYVGNVHYPSGAVGCVSRNYSDRKWRIVCDERERDAEGKSVYTYRSRDEAARAERALTQALY